ncbi:TrgA family protein [Jannaschia formosa]|uniref:TrgA family protein n=1 Tax=Jannaschia formosa TaxID=2259592 RepID=UPI000E1B62BD|nr:TrgA family protein [Jannaschia formosa]TFL18514.1 TrgA family protein [Jannaschia formosa]
MPTPAKLISALLFAALAWWTAETIRIHALPEGIVVGNFREWCALAGLIIGWKTIGTRVSGPLNKGTTVLKAVTAGIGGAVILTVGGVILNSFVTMISESLGRKYTEVGQAAEAWMAFLWDDALTIANPIVLGTMFGGAAVVGLIGGVAGRTLR